MNALSTAAPSALFDMTGRIVLLTGGAGGIASGLARGFAAAGARLILADRNVAVEARAEDLRRSGADVRAITFDIADEAAREKAMTRISAEMGGLDVLVNNAAVIHRQPALEVSLADWKRVLDIDVTACFAMAQLAAKLMIPKKRGRIVNLSSIMNHVSRPNLAPYVTAKGAVAAMTRALAADLAGTGITVNALAPGYTKTEFSQANVKEFHDFIAEWTPAKRWGTPDDLIGPALLLASDAGAYVNGQVLYVDGGFLAVTR